MKKLKYFNRTATSLILKRILIRLREGPIIFKNISPHISPTALKDAIIFLLWAGIIEKVRDTTGNRRTTVHYRLIPKKRCIINDNYEVITKDYSFDKNKAQTETINEISNMFIQLYSGIEKMPAMSDNRVKFFVRKALDIYKKKTEFER